MEIFMFIMFLVCNLFVVLIVKFTFGSVYSYSNGMMMGVHIPSEHVKDADVEDLLNSSKKQMRIFQNINTLLSIAICFIIFWNIIIFFLAFFCMDDRIVCGYLGYQFIFPQENVLY